MSTLAYMQENQYIITRLDAPEEETVFSKAHGGPAPPGDVPHAVAAFPRDVAWIAFATKQMIS